MSAPRFYADAIVPSAVVAAMTVGNVALATPPRTCECRPAAPVVLPPAEHPPGTPYRAPLNTHVWILGQYPACAAAPHYELRNRDGTVRAALRSRANRFVLPIAGTPMRYVYELIPDSLAPRTPYDVVLLSEAAPVVVATFSTGTTRDDQAPSWSGIERFDFVKGAAECSLGEADAVIRTSARDDAVPSTLLLLELESVSQGEREREERRWVLQLGEDPELRVHGGDSCNARDFAAPAPLVQAKLSGRILDLSGNASTTSRIDLVGPHTPLTRRMVERARALRLSEEKRWARSWTIPFIAGVGVLVGLLGSVVVRRLR